MPPLIEGNVFVSLFEGATGFSIGACQPPGQCAVELVYDNKKASPIRWSDRVMLVKEGAGWRVNDVAYGGKWPFANTGSLIGTLNTAIGIAPP